MTIQALYSDGAHVWALADEYAAANGAPVAIISRDGWFAISEEPPDDLTDGYPDGWKIVAFVEPS